MYRNKAREKIGPLKTDTGDVIDDSEGMSKLLNNYFLSVFTQQNLSSLPEGVQVYEGNDNDRLRDVTITRQIVLEEIDKLKKSKSPDPDEIFPRVLKECKEVLSGH